jgi:hypothetical protein
MDKKDTNQKRKPKNPKYAKGEEGMEMAKGGNIKTIFKKYEENEDNNMHSENIVLLAKHFGTKEQLEEANEILKSHNKVGYLTSAMAVKRKKLDEELYPKMVERIREEGISKEGRMMESGGEMHRMDDGSYKKGGTLKNKANYLPNRDIESITTWDGNIIDGSDILDGIYVKKRVKI